MCGIFGIWSPDGVHREKTKSLLGMMAHRGPDVSNIWVGEGGRLALGHNRLKILDLSDSANQPMQSPDGRFTMVYNGEIVNFRRLRAAHRGHWDFRTDGDSEVLLASFIRDGVKAADHWIGMFACIIHDAERKKLHIVRDRFGIKPLYWVELPEGGLAFSSEIPPLLKLLSSVSADESTILKFLSQGIYDDSTSTFFKGVSSLAPGTTMTVDLATGERKISCWYSLADHVKDISNTARADLIDQGAEVVKDAITDHLIADVPVGLNVSGGVDSSVLVNVAKQSVPDIHVFSQDYPEPYSESSWVRKVSEGTALHLCKLDCNEIEARLEATVFRQAEPFGGVFVVGYDAIYEAADEHGVTVLLDGNGVDECFLGYSRYVKAQSSEQGIVGAAIDGTSPVAADAISHELKRRVCGTPVQKCNDEFDDAVKNLAAADLLSNKIPRGLRFNDRMSMGRSKELRVPFLDHRVVEFGFSVPVHEHLNGRETKSLFREVAERWIPRDVAHAPKRSVQSPQREWFAEDWRPMMDSILASPSFAERGWVDTAAARRAYDAYLGGAQQNSFFLWQWTNLELWARDFLD